MLWIVVKYLDVDCFRSVVNTGNQSGISVESCSRYQNQGIPGQGKNMQQDPTKVCSEYLCPTHVGLGLEICTVEVCGSDDWQKDLHEKCTTFDRSAYAVTILLWAVAVTFRPLGMCLALRITW